MALRTPPRPRTLLLLLEFDGTKLHGWQQQAGPRTAQGELRTALRRLTGADVELRASSRTDAGVHALALPVSFRTSAGVPLLGFLRGLNTLLPDDISVRAVREVPEGFDARDASRGKRYRYDIWNAGWRSALRRHRCWWVRGMALDLAAMQEAATHLLGEHDFSSFRAARCDARSTRRQLTRVDVSTPEPHLVRVVVEGDAFLRNMVRILVGTLVEVGRGRRAPGDIPGLIAARDRTLAGRTAPPQGLLLERVFYDEAPAEPTPRGVFRPSEEPDRFSPP